MLKAMIHFRNYRWAARLSGFLAFVLITSFLTGRGCGMLQASSHENAYVFTLTFIGIAFLAYVAGWVIEIAGGLLMITSGIVLGIFLFTNQIFTSPVHISILSVSLIIPGIFYLFSWRHKLLRLRKANRS